MKIIEEYGSKLHPLVKEKIIEFGEANLPTTIDTLSENFVGCYLYDASEKMVGGITGHSYWNIMHVDFFWIDESLRGEGQGTILLARMEEMAKKEKCKVIHLETFSFQAPKFYEKNGYTQFGKIENVPVENCDYFFFKKDI